MPSLEEEFPNYVGYPPTRDGQATNYFYDRTEMNCKPYVLYVNGMNTTYRQHVLIAVHLSGWIDRWVRGVYNLKGYAGGQEINELGGRLEQEGLAEFSVLGFMKWATGNVLQVGSAATMFLGDLTQCLTDKVYGYNPLAPSTPEQFALWAAAQGLSPEEAVWEIVGHNLATLGLMYELMRQPRVDVVCHSQGNIITANAICAAACLVGRPNPGAIRVISLASPVSFWPPWVRVVKYGFTNDPVTWLSLGGTQFFGERTVEHADGFGHASFAAHDADVYLKKYGEGIRAIIDGA